MKVAGMGGLVGGCGTRKAALGFHTRPVGVAWGGGDASCEVAGWQAVAGTSPPGSGSLTRRGVAGGCGTPLPSYSVEHPVALSAIQKGLAPGVNATPHAFCRTGSVCGAIPGRSAVTLVTT